MSPSHEEHTMDTRTPSPGPRPDSKNTDTSSYQPDLSQEVSMLSTKLINAINYQTNLDDSLQHTRHELEAANRENARLRAEKKSLDDMVANGFLVRKTLMDRTVNSLKLELAKEKAAREEAEKARKQTDAELENLTTALFEEANTMVAAARKDTEAVEKRNSQLKSQINDTEMLLASQQEQLQDLKLTMGRMSERGENDTAGRESIPSTPIGSSAAMFDAMQLSPNATNIADIPPEHPLYFSHLLTPVLRNDIPAYIDFQDLLQCARKAISHSRGASSGNNSSGGLSSSSQSNLASNSSPSLPGAFSFSTSSSPQSSSFATTAPPLKDSKFYKRSLVEDIEPTLRLDLAPGLSFLSRRTVLSSLLQGSMVVEPFLPQTKFYGPIFACALCGESRKNEPYVRKHRFRTSEEESAQRYPLCDYCLSRTRAAGDFVGFLRMVRDGHWRAETEEEQKGAWEEAVRLRERMFWARQGGGVVPSLVKQGTPSTANPKSARQSLESIPEQQSPAKRASQAVQVAQEDGEQAELREVEEKAEVQETVEGKPAPDEKLMDVFKTHRRSMTLSSIAPEPTPEPTTVDEVPVVSEPQDVASELKIDLNPEPKVEEPAAEEATVIALEPQQLQNEVSEAKEPEAPVPAPEDLQPEIAAVEQPSVVAPEPKNTQAQEVAPESSVVAAEPVVEPTAALKTDDAVPETPLPVISTEQVVTSPETPVETPVETTTSAEEEASAVDDAPPAEAPAPSTAPLSPTLSTETASTLQAPAQPTQRRGSSVLARVRAMEANATSPTEEKKPPGSFD